MNSIIKRIFAGNTISNIILIGFSGIFLIISICNHYFFRTFCIDYGTYNFALYDIAHFRLSDSGAYLQPHINFLQDHITFTPYLLIPIYWIFHGITGSYTLLYVQLVTIIYGGWATYRLILLKTSEKYLALLALLLYFILFGRWTSFVTDCNWVILSSSMIPVLMYYLERKKLVAAMLTFVFILQSREDMALWIIFIGLFYLIVQFKDRFLRHVSISMIFVSAIYFILTFKFIIPAFETSYKHYTLFEYSSLGNTPMEALQFMIHHPLKTIKLLFVNTSGKAEYDRLKYEFYFVYFLSGGFLLLRRPKYLLLFIPILAKKMLNDIPVRWSIECYYSIEFVSILPLVIALIIAEEKHNWTKYILSGLVFSLALWITIAKVKGYERQMDWWGDKKYAFYDKGMYKADFDAKKVHRQLEMIPKNAIVSSNTRLLPHLAFREKSLYFPRVEDARYIAILTDGDTYPISKEQFEAEVHIYQTSPDWQVMLKDPPLLILKKK